MKIPTIQFLAVAALALGFTLTVDAGGTRGGLGRGRGAAASRPAASQRAAEESAEVTALRPAFTALLGADHDYEGHRMKAMVAIAAACRLMGTDIVPPDLRERLEKAGGDDNPKDAATQSHGEGAGEKHATSEPEAQTASDAQLHQAQTIVEQVRTGIAAGTQPRVAERLDEALKEIAAALAVK